MRGSEGGIPYHTPRRKLTVHAIKPGTFSKPLCNTTAWRFQTSTNPDHVTCQDCKRKEADDGAANDERSAAVD